MAKKIIRKVKIRAMGGAATPAPPIGPALGSAGANIGEFVQRFNADTQDRRGELVPVVLTLYEDRTFDMTYKTSPASALLKKAAKIDKGSGTNSRKKAGSVTKAQIKGIAEVKMPDLNAVDINKAIKIIEGTARSMGLDVK